MEKILELIRTFADEAHGAQTRKYTPERYIVHPVRVMKMCRKYDCSIEVLAAALLHDVVEDTVVSIEEIEDFLQTMLPHSTVTRVVQLVTELTDVYTKAAYPHLNRSQRKDLEFKRLAAVSAKAQTIKYADIIDNSIDIIASDPDFALKYLQEGKTLLNLMRKGNSKLSDEAKLVVDSGISNLKKPA